MIEFIILIPFAAMSLFIIYCFFYRSSNEKYIVVHTYDLLSTHLLQKSFKQIGVDIEYFRGKLYQGRICLIQLSIKENSKVIILDLIKMDSAEKEQIQEGLRRIFEDASIEKVFHSCPNDLEWLKEEFQFHICNIFDTQEFDRVLHRNKAKRGLNNLLKEYLNIKASNEAKNYFQTSNWVNRPLTSAQLNYAAMDSYYLLSLRDKLGLKLKEEEISAIKQEFEAKINVKTKPEKNSEKALRFFIANITKTQLDISDIIKSLYIEIIQINEEYAKESNINPELLLDFRTAFKICNSLPFHSRIAFDDIIKKKQFEIDISAHCLLFDKVKSLVLKTSSSIPSIQNQISEERSKDSNNKPLAKSKIEEIVEKFSCKHPIYESCKMLAPDGEVLCVCDNKKMNWYVSRKLAEIVSQEPPVFRLIFEPNEKGCNDEDGKDSKFYTTERLNRCVVCGSDDQYMRFHIVPVLYRQFFPEQLKSHKSHDVNLLCFNCNEKANKLYEIKKKQISEQYSVPLVVHSKTQEDFQCVDQLVRKAKTLCQKDNLLPEEGKLNLKKQIAELINRLKQSIDYSDVFAVLFANKGGIALDDLNDDVFEKIAKYRPHKLSSSAKKNLHGKLVVDQIKDLKAFIKEWRIFFLEELEPKFLPSEWRIDHQIVRSFGKLSQFKIHNN